MLNAIEKVPIRRKLILMLHNFPPAQSWK